MKPYVGKDPFLFVSYPHKSKETILPFLEQLQQAGYRIWWDDHIVPGEDYTDYIAEKLNGCSGVLFFLFDHINESKFCRKELKFAEDLDLKVVGIRDIHYPLKTGLMMDFSSTQRIDVDLTKSNLDFVDKVNTIVEWKKCIDISNQNTTNIVNDSKGGNTLHEISKQEEIQEHLEQREQAKKIIKILERVIDENYCKEEIAQLEAYATIYANDSEIVLQYVKGLVKLSSLQIPEDSHHTLQTIRSYANQHSNPLFDLELAKALNNVSKNDSYVNTQKWVQEIKMLCEKYQWEIDFALEYAISLVILCENVDCLNQDESITKLKTLITRYDGNPDFVIQYIKGVFALALKQEEQGCMEMIQQLEPYVKIYESEEDVINQYIDEIKQFARHTTSLKLFQFGLARMDDLVRYTKYTTVKMNFFVDLFYDAKTQSLEQFELILQKVGIISYRYYFDDDFVENLAEALVPEKTGIKLWDLIQNPTLDFYEVACKLEIMALKYNHNLKIVLAYATCLQETISEYELCFASMKERNELIRHFEQLSKLIQPFPKNRELKKIYQQIRNRISKSESNASY